MLSTVKDAWKIPEIRRKMLFTLMVIFVFRIGTSVPIPFMDKSSIAAMFSGGSGNILNLMNMMAGGSIQRASIFAVGVGPYITASIVMQLLTFAIPALEELQKEGEEGRKKIQKYQKYLSILIATVTAAGYTFVIFKQAVYADTLIENLVIMFSLVAGTSFLTWLGDQISKNGVGNGISIIIFLGIIANLPRDVMNIINIFEFNVLNVVLLIVFAVAAVAIVAFVVALNEGERRIPVQYSKRVVGRKMYGGQNTHIPIKVSMAGVMPVIFASSILAIPGTIAQLTSGGFSRFLLNWFTVEGIPGTIIYSILNILLIMFFTYFYTAMQFNTVEYSKNLQQNGGFIPGIRPGKPTSDYLEKVVNRLVFVGGISLAIIASLPIIIGKFTPAIPMVFAGTSIIIVVGVVLETLRSLEQQMMVRHYKGFLN